MTEKRVYLADQGPFIYENTDDLGDTEGIFTGRKQRALTTDDAILLIAGADLLLEGSDTNPGTIKFLKGTTTTEYLALTSPAANRKIYINSDTSGLGAVVFGKNYAGTYVLLDSLEAYVDSSIILTAFGSTAMSNATSIDISNADTASETYKFLGTAFRPNSTKTVDCGTASYAWDDVYADDFQNVADFLFLDDRDDLAALKQIKGSGKIDPRTGLEMIDDDTLPEWMKSKDKKTGTVITAKDGKPYLSLRVVSSLLMGACRQLDAKISNLQQQLDAAVKNLQQGKNNA